MPRAVVASNMLLMLCASVLLGASMAARFAGLPDPDRPFPMAWLVPLTVLTAITALVFLLTEIFSGIKWLAVVATIAAATAIIGSYVSDLSSGGVVVLWLITWSAIAGWFAELAFKARADR